jgi:hypothetical protein
MEGNRTATSSTVDAKLKEFDRKLASTEADLEGCPWTDASGRVWNAGDVRVVSHLSQYMRERFERHLGLLRSRLKTA